MVAGISRVGADAGMRWWQPLRVLCSGLLAAILLSACSWLVNQKSPAEPPQPKALSARPAGRPAPKEVPQPKPIERASPAPAPEHDRRVAVLYAADVPAYAHLANTLVKRIGERARPIPLADIRDPNLASEIQEYTQVVAVGVKAALAAKGLSGKQLVFCYVFNFQAIGLADSYARGVSMVPPVEQTFAAWKDLAPDLKRVGVIVGSGHEELIDAARKAAGRLGLQLMVRVTHSDEGTIFEYKRLVPSIDGFWLLPDNRILSHRALRALMAYSRQHRIQVAAFSPEFFSLGAVMSISASEDDVVEQAVEAIAQAAEPGGKRSFRLLPLTRANVEVNRDAAQRLGHSSRTSLVQGGRHGNE